jgi:hypothetical protein
LLPKHFGDRRPLFDGRKVRWSETRRSFSVHVSTYRSTVSSGEILTTLSETQHSYTRHIETQHIETQHTEAQRSGTRNTVRHSTLKRGVRRGKLRHNTVRRSAVNYFVFTYHRREKSSPELRAHSTRQTTAEGDAAE